MTPHPSPEIAARQRWMAILARVDLASLSAYAAQLPPHTRLRGPETGMLMARGRAGGTGARFNLGEMTATRCTIRSATGFVGHATILGRDADRAELAARYDAAMQDPALRPALEAALITPLAAAQEHARSEEALRAAATRVDFFTMATMRS